MMKTIALMGAAAVTLSACRSARVDKASGNGQANWTVDESMDDSYLILSDAQRDLVNSNNAFAFNLFRKTMGMDSRVISPLSVTYLMGMLANGADGATRQQILATLGMQDKGQGQDGLQNMNEFARMMMEKSGNLDKAVTVDVANYIAVNDRFKVNGKFRKSVGQDYKAGVESLDFTSSETLKRINGWCSDHTRGMIPSIIDSVDPDAVSYLMNAIYFHGTWADKFNKDETKLEQFSGYTRDLKRVNMMHRNDKYSYAEGEGFSAVQIPYGNGAFCMTVLLPDRGKGVGEMMAAMDGEAFQALQGKMEKCIVDLKLPRFTTEVEQPLNEVISALGSPLIFSSNADFSNFSSGSFLVSKMLQKAKIEVSEEGTKAAAVTAAIMVMSALPTEEPRRVNFHADHPFAYIISERSTGSIFFMGQYTGN
ncbi:MAG: serpin family protein [Bacteroidaceae bacterium]